MITIIIPGLLYNNYNNNDNIYIHYIDNNYNNHNNNNNKYDNNNNNSDDNNNNIYIHMYLCMYTTILLGHVRLHWFGLHPHLLLLIIYPFHPIS
jgi:hypothetical protein